MKNRRFYNAETAVTISWLLMDYCWMIESMTLAWILSFTSIVLSFLALYYYKQKSLNDKFVLLATISWVMMNSVCLWGEELKSVWLLEISKIFFVFTLTFVLAALYFARKSDEKVDFKRLKIK